MVEIKFLNSFSLSLLYIIYAVVLDYIWLENKTIEKEGMYVAKLKKS